MVMFTPSQSHSGGVIVKPYTGNIAQELQFLTGGKKEEASKAYTGLLFEPLMRKWFNFFETVLINPFKFAVSVLRSVREVCKDFNIMSSSLSADRVKSNQRLLGANS